MQYKIDLERGDLNLPELETLYRTHYGEMQARLEGDGFRVSDFDMRLDVYLDAWKTGRLLNFVARPVGGEDDGKAVGYANVYLTHDMHNRDFIATEDAIYVLPAHRNGLGRKIVKHALADLRARGVRRVNVNPVTDLRVAKIWQRMGFREVAVRMTFEFEEN